MTEPVAATTTKAAAAAKASTKSKSSSKSGSKSKTESVASGDWERTSYYNAESNVAENIVFLGNYGGEGSGVFDT